MKRPRIDAFGIFRVARSQFALAAGRVLTILLFFLFVGEAQTAPAFYPVDLSGFYTTIWSNAPSAFPRGTQTWVNVPFVVGGKIEVTGMDAARFGEFLPPQVAGIPVHQKASRLHLLHAARHGQKDGVPLANLVLHFKNGDTRVLRLAYGVHARNAFETERKAPRERERELADPNSSIVWSGPPASGNAPAARLFATALDNPQPDDEIEAIDFISLFGRATPMLFAVTVQTGGELRPLVAPSKQKVVERGNEIADAGYRRELRVRVTGQAGGESISNAIATVAVKDDQRSFYFGQYASGADGEIVVPYPPQEAVSINLRVASPGFVAAGKTFSIHDPAEWPAIIGVALERGRTIGGIVLDASGQPVANASVIPFEVVQTGSNQFARTDFDPARSAADGKWTTTALSQSLSNLSFEIRHPEHRTVVYSHLASEDLLAGKVRMPMDPEVRVAGRVVNDRRAPMAEATVILDLGGDSRMVRPTDARGRFSFVVRDPTNRSAAVIVIATNYAPAYRSVPLELNAGDLADIVVDPGQDFAMKMVDGAGRPVSDVVVTLSQWQGSAAMQWSTRTGADGRFRWDHAPSGSITFQYEKPGYTRHTHSITLPVRGEMTFTYSAPTRIAGRVLDSDTQKPIESFRARVRYKYKNGGGSGTSTMTGSKGRFSTYLGSTAYEDLSLLIEAKGYEPFGTNLPPNEGSSSNVFKLRKAKLIPGVVWGPNGSPVPKAEVVLLDRNTSAYMDEPGRFRRSSTTFETAMTDGAGKFELTPKLEPDLVLAAHPVLGFAQMSFKEMTNGAKLILKPWGRVEGVMRVGEKIEPYYYAALHTSNMRDADSGRTSPGVYTYFKTRPEADGRFVFEGVPPGSRAVYLRHMFSEKETGSIKIGHGVPVTVRAGETNQVVIGGSGRTVTGKVEVTGGDGIQIDWRRAQQTLRAQTVSRVSPPLTFPRNATAEERRKLMAQRSEEMNARMRAENLVERTYSIVIEDDGSFHAHSVPPGTYMLQLSPVQSQSATSYRYLSSTSRQVVIPEGPGPHNLGVIPYQVRQ